MARKMKKFSAGGAQGRYDRRMADIDKDFAKDSKGKSGRALEVLEAKRAQRTADAKDDLAKRTGADRTATRKAEYDAEKNLSRTRKFGADKPAAAPAATPDMVAQARAVAAADAPEAAKAKPQSFGAAFKEARARLGAGKTFTYNGKSFTTNIAGEGRKPVQKAAATPVKAASTPVKAASTPVKAASTPVKAASTPVKAASTIAPSGIALLQATKVAREKKEAEERKKRIGMPAHERMAKGGKVKKETTMKYAKGGSTPTMNNKPKTPKTPKEPITGGANTVPLTPQRKEFLKELAKRNAKPGMAKGGKATKFGAAMVKKSADTKGRAMMKFAKGGSIDGCAIRGKTKGKMLASGGSCGMGKGRK